MSPSNAVAKQTLIPLSLFELQISGRLSTSQHSTAESTKTSTIRQDPGIRELLLQQTPPVATFIIITEVL